MICRVGPRNVCSRKLDRDKKTLMCKRYGLFHSIYPLLHPTRAGQCITSMQGVYDFMTADLPWAKYIVVFFWCFSYQKT